ncbi:hypothetical protein G5I_01968 [Acromyrmex echinatior]|uniref:Uncharacterized protein n=1 Tax=Acromyrmex echinatior TaxID=103372 RepID=F4W922_ACREC|nr:hypothetical protein G5I_01968 [Acromyrmex echinatior]
MPECRCRKDRLTAEVRGPKWFDVTLRTSGVKSYAGASETAARRRERDRARRRRKTPREREWRKRDRASERNDGSTMTEDFDRRLTVLKIQIFFAISRGNAGSSSRNGTYLQFSDAAAARRECWEDSACERGEKQVEVVEKKEEEKEEIENIGVTCTLNSPGTPATRGESACSPDRKRPEVAVGIVENAQPIPRHLL